MSRPWPGSVVLLLLLVLPAALGSAAAGCDGDEAVVLDDCVKAYPRGNMPIASMDALSQAVVECQGDSGGCMAASACVGQPADRNCDPKGIISPDAALCVAQANGLERGLDRLRPSLVYNYIHRRLSWNVSNTLYDSVRVQPPPGANGARGGVAVVVDAHNARVLATTEWGATQ
jgi:hypothetical protein